MHLLIFSHSVICSTSNPLAFQGFPKLIFSFSPKVLFFRTFHSLNVAKGSSGGICQDLGHSLDSEIYCNAQTMGTTFVQQTLGWNDALFCAGGVQVR